MEQYNKWVMTDPAQKTTLTGVDGEVGFIYAWDSKNKQAGKGEQEIKEIELSRKIALEIRFIRPFEGISYSDMFTETISQSQTKVTFAFKGSKNYGMKIAHVILKLEKVLGRDLEATLRNLKQVLEK